MARAPRHKCHWSPAELDILHRAYGRHPIAALAAQLGRSPRALVLQAQAQGLGRARDYPLVDVAAAIGCSRGTVRRWIRCGWLAAGLLQPAPTTGRRYSLSDWQLHAFFCDHPTLWQRYPCPGRAWIAGLITAPALRRPQDPAPPPRGRPGGPAACPGPVEYSGPRQPHKAWR